MADNRRDSSRAAGMAQGQRFERQKEPCDVTPEEGLRKEGIEGLRRGGGACCSHRKDKTMHQEATAGHAKSIKAHHGISSQPAGGRGAGWNGPPGFAEIRIKSSLAFPPCAADRLRLTAVLCRLHDSILEP